MTLFHTIRRRFMINRAVRELSGLNNTILQDIGIDRANITEMVEKMIDSNAAPSVGSKQAGVGYATATYTTAHGAAV